MDGSPQRGSLHATTPWHFDAAEWAPSTASKTDSVARICDVRFTLEGRHSVSASLGIVCPGQISAAPGEAAAERCQDQPVTCLEAMFIVPQAERDRRRRRVAEFMDGDHHAVGRKLH